MTTPLPPETLEHSEYEPTQALKPFVSRLLQTYSTASGLHVIPVPPSGSMYLNYVYGDPIHFCYSDGIDQKASSLFVGGQLQKEIPVAQVRGEVRLMGIEFTPTGFYRLFHQDCGELTDRMVLPLSKWVPKQTQALIESLRALPDMASRRDCLQDFLLAFVENALDASDVERVIDKIERSKGHVSVEKLSEYSGVSARQLNRLFLKKVGVGPKHFAKVLQLKHALTVLQDGDQGELQNIAQRAGYYDQAHFIRDFQRFIGTNPLAFLRDPDPFLETYLCRQGKQGED